MVSALGIMAPVILVLSAATFWAYHNVELEKRSLEEFDRLKKQEDAMALLEKRPLSWIQKAFKCVSCEEPYRKQKEEESALLLQRQEHYKQALDAVEQHRYRGKIAGIVGIALLLTSFLSAFRNKFVWIPVAISSFCLGICARASKESSSLKHSLESFIQRVVKGSNNKDPLDKAGTEVPLIQPEQDTSEASSSNTPEKKDPLDKAGTEVPLIQPEQETSEASSSNTPEKKDPLDQAGTKVTDISETTSSHTPAMPGSSSDAMVFDGRAAKEEAERLAKEEVERVVKEKMEKLALNVAS